MKDKVQLQLQREIEMLKQVNSEYLIAMTEYKQLFETYKDLYNQIKYKLDDRWSINNNKELEITF